MTSLSLRIYHNNIGPFLLTTTRKLTAFYCHEFDQTVPIWHLSRSSVIRATLQGRTGRELRVTSTGRTAPSPTVSQYLSRAQPWQVHWQSQTRWSDVSGQRTPSRAAGDRVKARTWNKAAYNIGLVSSLENQPVRQDEAELRLNPSTCALSLYGVLGQGGVLVESLIKAGQGN